jgi:hypothetical protein
LVHYFSASQPESIFETFLPDLNAFFEIVEGRVKLIHELFNQIGYISFGLSCIAYRIVLISFLFDAAMGNGKPPPPPQFVSFLLDLSEDQIKKSGPEGPVVSLDQVCEMVFKNIMDSFQCGQTFSEAVHWSNQEDDFRERHERYLREEICWSNQSCNITDAACKEVNEGNSRGYYQVS